MHRLLFIGPLLSRRLLNTVAACLALLYLAVFANARRVLPEFIFRDADKIQTQIGGGTTYVGSSFDAVAHFYLALGEAGTSTFVATLGVVLIWMAMRETRRLGSLFVNVVLIAPCLFFNLFVASKDTLVVLIAIVLLSVARRLSPARTLCVAFALYLCYAIFIRSYFALIVGLAGCVWGARQVPLLLKIVALLLMCATLLALPNSAYFLLQHPRDAAVDYLVYESPFGARSSFYNPFAPDSFAHFVGNYAFSLVRLNVPILFSLDLKVMATQVFFALVLASAWKRVPRGAPCASALPGAETLACVVLGHVAVSMLFEPDLGSYTRHLSSVALLASALWPLRTDHPPGSSQPFTRARVPSGGP